MKKNGSANLTVIVITAVLLFVTVSATAVYYFKGNGQYLKHIKHYGKKELEEIVGSSLNERERKIDNYPCKEYYTDNNSKYADVRFYAFDEKSNHDKIYKDMKSDWIGEITDEGENYIQGWENGVCDAAIEIFIYKSGNLIITTDIQVVSCWAESPDDPITEKDNSAAVERLNKALETTQLIIDTF